MKNSNAKRNSVTIPSHRTRTYFIPIPSVSALRVIFFTPCGIKSNLNLQVLLWLPRFSLDVKEQLEKCFLNKSSILSEISRKSLTTHRRWMQRLIGCVSG